MSWLNDATILRKYHGWSTVVWFGLAFPICIFFSTSVPLLVFISVYAIVTSEFSSWQASRIEEKQADAEREQNEKFREMIEEIVKRVDNETPDK